jgi:hypothetical protein
VNVWGILTVLMLIRPKQSAALLSAIKEYDSKKWVVIGQKVGKPAKVGKRISCSPELPLSEVPADGYKACEQYAKEHFGGKG